ncbi:hypothetical protein HBI56_187330 [Parastagonospora nodorum]|uniref:Uncharacterized protein n=1 Tax=Phaeosphaeria nodorum (strain SN15 / ATCC MYA-4574 / FGSC 10173) TaxID=321614 RepID=A0A7U2IAV2_PHANO|nr:hypothetical protein HBH56_162180 [Parastagonospora nodorum]QRD06396.1 hypothetical protein JI435_423310 [Parastagonospora nodorum SN15]KAH3931716.1 hypothetical protein HBH54_087050 [Parastagonospora nodorum]KAH3947591.1 hypothetical protein HBH53_114280 [Parastagonospora nodorum]KAH3968984.1 hypothetical protein HBH52_175580 [Parastagonospora nodorum]
MKVGPLDVAWRRGRLPRQGFGLRLAKSSDHLDECKEMDFSSSKKSQHWRCQSKELCRPSQSVGKQNYSAPPSAFVLPKEMDHPEGILRPGLRVRDP